MRLNVILTCLTLCVLHGAVKTRRHFLFSSANRPSSTRAWGSSALQASELWDAINSTEGIYNFKLHHGYMKLQMAIGFRLLYFLFLFLYFDKLGFSVCLLVFYSFLLFISITIYYYYFKKNSLESDIF